MIARWLFLFSLFSAWPVPVLAQELRFQHITSDDGLSDNAITCIFEDRAGYIWIGTEHGLNRYDGHRVERFAGGSNGPDGKHISSIDQDGRGRLYITTTDGGLAMHDPRTGAFANYRNDSTDKRTIPTDKLNHVLVWNDTLIFLSSRARGLIRFNPDRGTFRTTDHLDPTVNAAGDSVHYPGEGWYHIAVRIDDERLWTTHIRNPRTLMVNALDGSIRTYHSTLGADSSRILTNAMIVNGALYAGGWQRGINRIPISGDTSPTFLPIDDEVTAIAPWEGDLLVGTKNNGLILLDTAGKQLMRFRHHRGDASSLGNDHIRGLMVDRGGNVWVSTARGLSVHAPAVWPMTARNLFGNEKAAQPDLTFHALQQDPNGTIRVSTSHGFFLLRGDSARHVTLRSGETQLEVTGLFHLADNMHYVGTETGLFRYTPGKEALDSTDGMFVSSFMTERMFQVRSAHLDSVDNKPRLLVGALGYAMEIVDPIAGGEGLLLEEGFTNSSASMMRCTQRDADGTYWTATVQGVAHWSLKPGLVPVGRQRYAVGAPGDLALPGNDATSLTVQRDTVWVALRDAGLASIVRGAALSHVPPSHMPHDVLGVAIDRSGRAWCTTSNGTLCFDPRTEEWLHVPVNDGQAFKQLTKCILALENGHIALCADNSLITFDPSAFGNLPGLPVPRLVEVRNTWGPLSISASGEVEISYRSSAFDASITALQTTGADPLEFLYRLEGVEEEARVVTAREPMRYAGVPVGTHRLLVRVRDAYGREGPEHALFTVTVTGPFWQRWWFFVLMLGAGALGMYLVSRLRQKQRLRLQGVRDRIARDLHDDIGSTLGSISFYSEALKRKLSGTDDTMAQQVAEKIGSSSRDMIDQMSDIVWSVDPKNDDAGALTARLQAFASDLLAAKNIPLHFHADAALNERKLTAEQRRNIFLICKEVLHNTVKYADARSVTITVESTSRALELVIEDDGKGFDPENTDSYNGNGLPNMRVRAEAIGAVFTVDSSPGSGTRARITVPQHMFTPRSGD